MCDFKETVFQKECINQICLSLKCFKSMHDIATKWNDHIAFMNHIHWYLGGLWRFVVKKIKNHFKHIPVLSKTILKSREQNSWKKFYRLSLQELIHCPVYKRLHCNNMKSKLVKDISLLSYSFIDTYLETMRNEFRILIFPRLDIQQSKSVTSCVLCALLSVARSTPDWTGTETQETDYYSQHQYQRESQECSLLALCCFDKKGVYSRKHYHA